jgi:hypothetical protein
MTNEQQQRRRARLAWLRTSGLLADLPGTRAALTTAQRQALDLACTRMMALGLYAPRTAARAQVQWSIRVMVSELRQAEPPKG